MSKYCPNLCGDWLYKIGVCTAEQQKSLQMAISCAGNVVDLHSYINSSSNLI